MSRPAGTRQQNGSYRFVAADVEDALRGQLLVSMTCLCALCGWSFTGPAEEGLGLQRAHREGAHPERRQLSDRERQQARRDAAPVFVSSRARTQVIA